MTGARGLLHVQCSSSQGVLQGMLMPESRGSRGLAVVAAAVVVVLLLLLAYALAGVGSARGPLGREVLPRGLANMKSGSVCGWPEYLTLRVWECRREPGVGSTELRWTVRRRVFRLDLRIGL